jgi:hypothetical protein
MSQSELAAFRADVMKIITDMARETAELRAELRALAAELRRR